MISIKANNTVYVPAVMTICLTSVSPVLSLSPQPEESQYWLWAYVRGGAYCHQELPPHQRNDVGAGGQVHGRRQAWTAQPLKQVRCELFYQTLVYIVYKKYQVNPGSRAAVLNSFTLGDRRDMYKTCLHCLVKTCMRLSTFVLYKKKTNLQSCCKYPNITLILQVTQFNRCRCCRYLVTPVKNKRIIDLILQCYIKRPVSQVKEELSIIRLKNVK